MNDITDPKLTRAERAEVLFNEYGVATMSEIRNEPLDRYLLREGDAGSADNGGPWWSTSDDWTFLLYCSANQEYAEDWPAEILWDLDTGSAYPLAMQYVVTSDEQPPPVPANVRRRALDGSQTVETAE